MKLKDPVISQGVSQWPKIDMKVMPVKINLDENWKELCHCVKKRLKSDMVDWHDFMNNFTLNFFLFLLMKMYIFYLLKAYIYQIFFSKDIDECAEATSGCQQICTNSPGSYSCSCVVGHTLKSDNKTCEAPGI